MNPIPTPFVRERIALLEAISIVAVEHDDVLEPMALANLVDLYAQLLESEPDSTLGFERFVRDGDALARAAAHAERVSGVPTAAPAPLGQAARRVRPAVESTGSVVRRLDDARRTRRHADSRRAGDHRLLEDAQEG